MYDVFIPIMYCTIVVLKISLFLKISGSSIRALHGPIIKPLIKIISGFIIGRPRVGLDLLEGEFDTNK